MARPKSEMEPSEQTLRLLAVLVRQNAQTQTEAIVELHRAGFGPSRIGELLGTSAGTAKVAIQRFKRRGSADD